MYRFTALVQNEIMPEIRWWKCQVLLNKHQNSDTRRLDPLVWPFLYHPGKASPHPSHPPSECRSSLDSCGKQQVLIIVLPWLWWVSTGTVGLAGLLLLEQVLLLSLDPGPWASAECDHSPAGFSDLLQSSTPLKVCGNGWVTLKPRDCCSHPTS